MAFASHALSPLKVSARADRAVLRLRCGLVLMAVTALCSRLGVSEVVVQAGEQSAGQVTGSPVVSPPAGALGIAGLVTDSLGMPLAGVSVRSSGGKLLGTSDATGHVAIACPVGCPVVLEAVGFTPRKVQWHEGSRVALELAAVQQSVSVTAYRTPLGDLESPVSTRMLTSTDLRQAAPITLDGQLRMIPGVETFRRSSSLVANPSSQGLSLRGLGSTSASRTLVTQDDVPLNDAFGGWIHWEEVPELSIHSLELVRGGASDLYGSSAIGGVVNVIPRRPTSDLFEMRSSYAGLGTYDDSALGQGRRGRWGGLASGGVLGTNGFVTLTPDSRGSVDVKSNVHAQNGMFLLEREEGPVRLFGRVSALNEARDNGTVLQKNGTRLWRFAVGTDWTRANGSSLTFRAYGSAEHYRQTFTTIAASRNFEKLNRFAKTPNDEMGAVLHWNQPLAPGLLMVIGADTHDVRANDQETVIAKTGAVSHVNLSDRQRQTGAYAEALWTHAGWTMTGSGRLDWFSNFDGAQWQPVVQKLPHLTERVFDPRFGLSRKLGGHFAISGTGFWAYRAPSPNELYRSTQVGNFLTLPNSKLQSERAVGWETGIAMEQRWGTLRTSYFWTQVNSPITALTLDEQSSPRKLQRENLGQIESRGISADLQLQPRRWMTLDAGYQHTNATVTEYELQPGLVGHWIPQVAHNTATAQLRGYKPKLGTLSLQGRLSGRQFDDDANSYLLHGYVKLDAYASHEFGKRLEIFTSAENLFDRTIEVGRTPTLTLGTPRVARAGFQLKLGPGLN